MIQKNQIVLLTLSDPGVSHLLIRHYFPDLKNQKLNRHFLILKDRLIEKSVTLTFRTYF